MGTKFSQNNKFMKRLTRLIPALCLLWFGHHAFSQSMGIGIETPNQNAVLHLVSPNNDQGLMIPQLTTAQRTATSFISRLTSSDNGLLVFDVDENAFYYWHDNSWQSLRTSVNISAGTGISLVDGEISNTGDLDATNELQDISLTGTNLTISNGSTIDLSAIDTNTQLDEAAVDAFVSNNGYLTSVDLSGYDTDSSDDFDGDYSSLANAPTSLSQFTNDAGFVTSANDADADETNELITGVTLESGNILRITDAGGNNDIDLSSLQDGTGTDSQDLSFDGTNLNISGGTGIDISGWDTDATNELITGATLSGTTLTITDAGGNNDVDLSSLSTSTDSQDLSFDGTNLNISGGTGIDISGWDTDSSNDFDGAYSSLSGAPTNLSDFTNDSGFITSADDADADATNELITGASLTGTTLRITDAGGNNDVDLSTLQDGTGTDSQNLSFDGTNLNISGGTGLDVSGWDTDASDDFDGTYSALIGAPTAVTAFTNDAGYITSADDADADASNELITAASLTGTTLRITDAGGNNDVDLSSLQDGTGTDDQVASEVPVTPANGVTSTTVQAALEELQGEIAAGGGGDMLESIYDADGDNIVDDSELVNGLTVLTAVPAGAVFTDTQLEEGAVDFFVSNNGYLVASDLTGYDSDASDDFDGAYSSLTGAPTAVSAFTNDAGYITSPNDADASTTNELITAASLTGTTLRITDAGGNNDVDLASLQDGTGTDSQNLSFDGTNLNISGGTGLDVSGWDTDASDDFDGAYSSLTGAPTAVSAFTNDAGYITSPNDADASTTNELITAASLTGTTLRITDAGGNNDVDLASLQDGTGTDSQNLSFDGTNLNISGGTGLNVSGWDTDASDDFDGAYSSLTGAPTAVSSFTNDAGYITSPNDADASATNELITGASFSGTTLTISDAGGDTDVDLAGLQDGTGTDSQNLSFDGTNLNISGGTGLNVSGWDTDASDDFDGAYSSLTGAPTAVSSFTNDAGYITSPNDADASTTNELITGASFSGTTLTISDAGGDTDVDLAGLQDGTGTDSQNLSFDGTNLNISGGTGLNVSGWDTDASDDFDGAYSSLTGAPTAVSAFTNDAGYITSPNDADASTTNELITGASFSGTTLTISDAGGDTDVDLAGLQDGTGTDSQNLSFDGTNLNISGGTGLNVSGWDTDASDDFDGAYSSLTGAPTAVSSFTNDAGYITSPNDADASTTNELITGASFSGTTLTISDAGGDTDVDLAGLQDGTGTDSQNLSFDGTNLNISGGTGLDVSLWDTDASDDFSFPTAQTITNAGPILDLTNSGQGAAAAFSSDSDSEQTVSITSTGDNLNANATLTVNRRNSGPATTYPTDIAEFRYFDNKILGIDEEGVHFANSGVYPATIAVDDNSSSAGRNLVIQSGFGTTSGGNIRLEAGASGEGERADVFVQASSFHMGRNEIDDNGGIRFDEEFSNGTNYVAFQAPASIASNVSWELPNADGSNGQVFTTNGSGTLSWSTVDTDNTNELLTSGGMSGNFLRLFEGSNNVNVDLSQFAELPSQSGNSGRFLTTNGSSVSWATVPSGGLWTANGSDAYYSTGSVGIGTSTPQNPLHVTETVAAVDGTDGAFIDIQNLNSNTNAMAGIRFKSNTSVSSDSYKGGIFFSRGGADGNPGGFGSLILAMNSGGNTTNVTSADAKLSIGVAGASVTGNLDVSSFFTSNGVSNFNDVMRVNAELDINNEMQVGNGAGTAGYVLESAGAGAAPFWQAPVWDVTYGTTDLIYLGPGIGTNRVGMGTADPSTNLEVQSALSLTPQIELESTGTASEEASIRYLTIDNTFSAGVNSAGTFVIADGNNVNTGSQRMTINSSGTIGLVGTVAMSQILQHSGDTDTDMQFTTDRISFRAGNRTMLDLTEGTSDYILMNSTNMVSTSTYFDVNTPFYAALTQVSVSSGTNQVRINNTNDQLVEYFPTVCPFFYIDNGDGYVREANIIEAQAHKYLERLQSSIIPINEDLEEVKVKIQLEEPETSFVDYLAIVIHKYDSVTNQELIDTLEVKSSSLKTDVLSKIDKNYHIMQIGDSFEITFDRSPLMSGEFTAYVLSSGYYDIDFQAYQLPEWKELKYEKFAQKSMDLDENGNIVQFRPLNLVNPQTYGYTNPEALLKVEGNVVIENGRFFTPAGTSVMKTVESSDVKALLQQEAVTDGDQYALDNELIKEYLPQLVNENGQIAQSELIPLLIEALKAQSSEVKDLKNELSESQSEIAEMKAQINTIYTLLNNNSNNNE